MKNLLICCSFFLISFQIYSQGSIKMNLEIFGETGKPLANTEVFFTEMNTRDKIPFKTDALGKVLVEINKGRFWQLEIVKIRNNPDWQYEVPEAGERSISQTIVYNYKNYLRVTAPIVDRTKLNLKKIQQHFSIAESATDTLSVVRIELNDSKGKGVPNIEVCMVNFLSNTIYAAKTNSSGVAVFKVPYNKEYQLDIDGIENYHYLDTPARKRTSVVRTIEYQPSFVKEINVNDTIVQDIPYTEKTGSSNRVLITVYMEKQYGGRDYWKNERIYARELKGKKVYKGVTDFEGKMIFLLPKGQKYMIDGYFQKDLDVVNLQRFKGIGYGRRTVIYKPDERLQYPENFIPKPDRLFLNDFSAFIEKQLPEPTSGNTMQTYTKWCNKVNADSKQALFQLGFKAEKVEPGAWCNSPNVNISLVMDISGSMSGADRIDNLKIALEAFVKKLRNDDVVSLVSFESDKHVEVSADKYSVTKEDLLNVIPRLETAGSTNILAGMVEGYEQVLKNYKKSSTNRIILLTDGYGDNPVSEIMAKSKEYNAKGIECSTVGVGDDYNAALLNKLATQGGGTINFVNSAQQLPEVLCKELNEVVFPIATDMKVEVLYNKKLLFAELFGYPLKEKTQGKLVLKLKNAYSGLSQLGMIKFSLVNPDQTIEKEPIIVKNTFFDERLKKKVTHIDTTYLSWSAENGLVEYQMEKEDKKLYAIAVMNQALKVMADAFFENNRPKAMATLQVAIKEMKLVFPTAEDKDVDELLASLVNYLSILTNSKK